MRIIVLVTLFLFAACNSKAPAGSKPPTTEEIKQALVKLYDDRMTATIGGGGIFVEQVELLNLYPGTDPEHYSAKVHFTGRKSFPVTADRKPDEPHNETRMIKLAWQEGKWVCVDNY